jgi:hypothetical protein
MTLRWCSKSALTETSKLRPWFQFSCGDFVLPLSGSYVDIDMVLFDPKLNRIPNWRAHGRTLQFVNAVCRVLSARLRRRRGLQFSSQECGVRCASNPQPPERFVWAQKCSYATRRAPSSKSSIQTFFWK